MNFHDCVYLSIVLEAKRDIYNTFDPDKPFNIHLDPPSTEQPPLVEIKQEEYNRYYADKSRKYKVNLAMKSIEIQNHMHDSVTHDFDRVSDFNHKGLTPLQGQQDEQPEATQNWRWRKRQTARTKVKTPFSTGTRGPIHL